MEDVKAEWQGRREFPAGHRIFAEGDVSDGAYVLLDGFVSVWQNGPDGKVTHLAQLGPGEIFGEIGTLDNAPRSATVTAETDIVAIFVTSADLQRHFSEQEPLVRLILNALAERVRRANRSGTLVAQETGAEAANAERMILIEGASTPATKALEGQRLRIDHFPFRVGRRMAADQTVVTQQSLSLAIPNLAGLASQHFELVRRDGVYMIVDSGAPAGTIVNGEKISRYSERATAPLLAGDNLVIAGGHESAMRFRVVAM
jgi:CRP-like cAMP-binding protein